MEDEICKRASQIGGRGGGGEQRTDYPYPVLSGRSVEVGESGESGVSLRLIEIQ